MFLSLQASRIRRFLQAILWTIQSGWLCLTRSDFIYVTVLDFLSAGSRGAVIATVAHFVTFVEAGETGSGAFSFLTQGGFLGVGIILLLLMTISSVTAYLTAFRRRAMARTVHVHFVDRVMAGTQKLDSPNVAALGLDQRAIVQITTRDALQTSIAFEQCLQLLMPFSYIAVAIVVMASFAPLLTLQLFGTILFLVPLVFLVSSRIHSQARSFYQESAQKMGMWTALTVNRSIGTNLPIAAIGPFATVDEVPPYRGYLDGFDEIQLANDRMAIVVSLFWSGFVAIGFVFFAWLASAGEQTWGQVVGFVGGMLLLANGVKTMLAYLANLNRFYPQISALYRFIHAIDVAIGKPEQCNERTDSGTPLRFIARPGLPDSWNELIAAPGDVIGLYSNRSLRRQEFESFLAPFIASLEGNAETLHGSLFVTQLFRVFNCDFSRLEKQRDRLFTLLETSGYALRDKGVITQSGELDDSSWDALDISYQSALRMVALAARRSPVVFIDSGVINNLLPKAKESLAEFFESSLVLVVSNGGAVRLPLISKYLVAKDDDLIGAGDLEWETKNLAKIQELSKSKGGAGAQIDFSLLS